MPQKTTRVDKERFSSRAVIGIDASRAGGQQRTGTETYSTEIINALVLIAPDEHFRFYFNSAEPPEIGSPDGEAVCIPFPRLWTHLRLSAELLRRRPGVLFVPSHVVPLVHPRTVVTIHDLGYLQ